MATQQKKRDGDDLQERDRLSARIALAVISTLGTPTDLRGIHVRPLWAGNYRVNIFTGTESVSATIAHSYFLRVDGNGIILEATPSLVKVY